MSSNIIANKIVEDARVKSSAIIADGEIKAKNILEENNKEIEKMLFITDKKAQEEGSLQKQRKIQNIKLQLRDEKLSAKQDVINEVLNKSVERLNNLTDNEFLKFFVKSLSENSFKGTGRVIINSKRENVITEKFIEVINDELEINLSLCNTNKLIEDDGFIIEQGNIKYNFTFKAIVNSLKDELTKYISKELF